MNEMKWQFIGGEWVCLGRARLFVPWTNWTTGTPSCWREFVCLKQGSFSILATELELKLGLNIKLQLPHLALRLCVLLPIIGELWRFGWSFLEKVSIAFRCCS